MLYFLYSDRIFFKPQSATDKNMNKLILLRSEIYWVPHYSF